MAGRAALAWAGLSPARQDAEGSAKAAPFQADLGALAVPVASSVGRGARRADPDASERPERQAAASQAFPDESHQEQKEWPGALPEHFPAEQGLRSSDAEGLAQGPESFQVSRLQGLAPGRALRQASQPEELLRALLPPDLHQRVLLPERVFQQALSERQGLRPQAERVWRQVAQPNGRGPL